MADNEKFRVRHGIDVFAGNRIWVDTELSLALGTAQEAFDGFLEAVPAQTITLGDSFEATVVTFPELGENQISNSTFTSNINGWSSSNCSISHSSGRLRVYNMESYAMVRTIPSPWTDTNYNYRIKARVITSGTSYPDSLRWNGPNTNDNDIYLDGNIDGYYEESMQGGLTDNLGTQGMEAFIIRNASGATVYFDNVELRRIEPGGLFYQWSTFRNSLDLARWFYTTRYTTIQTHNREPGDFSITNNNGNLRFNSPGEITRGTRIWRMATYKTYRVVIDVAAKSSSNARVRVGDTPSSLSSRASQLLQLGENEFTFNMHGDNRVFFSIETGGTGHSIEISEILIYEDV